MTYVDGFVIPVPTKNKAAYIRMAPALSMPPPCRFQGYVGREVAA